jgi:hypothetical protein
MVQGSQLFQFPLLITAHTSGNVLTAPVRVNVQRSHESVPRRSVKTGPRLRRRSLFATDSLCRSRRSDLGDPANRLRTAVQRLALPRPLTVRRGECGLLALLVAVTLDDELDALYLRSFAVIRYVSLLATVSLAGYVVSIVTAGRATDWVRCPLVVIA